jgi:hypothetical protein
MHREWQILISVVTKLLGWKLEMAIAGFSVSPNARDDHRGRGNRRIRRLQGCFSPDSYAYTNSGISGYIGRNLNLPPILRAVSLGGP